MEEEEEEEEKEGERGNVSVSEGACKRRSRVTKEL